MLHLDSVYICLVCRMSPTVTSHSTVELQHDLLLRLSVSVIFLTAVGIQMKLDFFQKKFWTASRQVCVNKHTSCIWTHPHVYIQTQLEIEENPIAEWLLCKAHG